MRLLFVLSVLFLAINIYAQINTDSIIDHIENTEDRAAQLNHIGQVCTDIFDDADPEAFPLYTYYIALTGSSSDELLKEEVLDLSYRFANQVNILSKLDEYITEYIIDAPEFQSSRVQAILYFIKSDNAYFDQDLEKAIAYADTVIQIVEEEGESLYNSIGYRKAQHTKGLSLSTIGDYTNGFIHIDRAKELDRIAQDTQSLVNSMVSMAILYSQIGLYDAAEKEFADKNKLNQQSLYNEAIENVNIARNFLLQGDYQKALRLYKWYNTLSQDDIAEFDPVIPVFYYNGIIEAHYYLNEADSIVRYFKLMNEATSDLKIEEQWYHFIYQQSEFIHLLNTGKLTEAERIAKSLYDDAKGSGDPSDIILYSGFLSDLYKKKNNPGKAISYLEEKISTADSLKSLNQSNALALFQTQFETEKKENQINQLSAEKALLNARTRLWTIVSLLSLIIVGIGAYFFNRLRKARNQIAQSNVELKSLNETKDKFFSIIAHDLRGPIASLETVERQINHYVDKEDMTKVKKVSGLMGKMTQNLSSLLDNLLNWALSQSGRVPYNPESIDLNALINENIELLNGQAAVKGVTITQSVNGDPEIYADRPAINTIIRNLLSNAIKYTNQGDQIDIKVDGTDSNTTISIADTGIGMSTDQLQQLFTLTTKSMKGTKGEKGTGLGLLLCKELAEINQGILSAKSTLGAGSIFTIEFSAAQSVPTRGLIF